MSVAEFFFCYALAGATMLLACHKDFAYKWKALFRTVLGVTSICFIIDYPAENREFWSFSRLSGLSVIDVPVENIIFTATSAVIALAIYLKMQRFFR